MGGEQENLIEERSNRPEWLFDDNHPTQMNWPHRRRQAQTYIKCLEVDLKCRLGQLRLSHKQRHDLEAEKERQDARYGDLLAEFHRQSERILELEQDGEHDMAEIDCLKARILHLESTERNLRESCEILRAMDAEKNTRIAELEAAGNDLLDERDSIITDQRARIAELEARKEELCTKVEYLRVRIAVLEAERDA